MERQTQNTHSLQSAHCEKEKLTDWRFYVPVHMPITVPCAKLMKKLAVQTARTDRNYPKTVIKHSK